MLCFQCSPIPTKPGVIVPIYLKLNQPDVSKRRYRNIKVPQTNQVRNYKLAGPVKPRGYRGERFSALPIVPYAFQNKISHQKSDNDPNQSINQSGKNLDPISSPTVSSPGDAKTAFDLPVQDYMDIYLNTLATERISQGLILDPLPSTNLPSGPNGVSNKVTPGKLDSKDIFSIDEFGGSISSDYLPVLDSPGVSGLDSKPIIQNSGAFESEKLRLLGHADSFLNSFATERIIKDLILHRLDAYIPVAIRPLIIPLLYKHISKAVTVYCTNRFLLLKFDFLTFMDDQILTGVANDMQRLHLNVDWTPQFLRPHLKNLLVTNLKGGLVQYCGYVNYSSSYRRRVQDES